MRSDAFPSLLRSLSESQRKEIAQCGNVLRFKKGERLFEEGTPAHWVWFIREGWVRLVKHGSGRRQLTLALVTPKEAFCGISVLEGGTYSAGGVAVTPIEALRIPSACFEKLVEENPEFNRRLLTLLTRRIRQVTSQFVSIAYQPVHQRIAQVLLHLSEELGPRIPMGARELAELAGTTVETTLRILARFTREGWIEHHRILVMVLNPSGLKALKESTDGSAKSAG